ncbi:MAG: DUF952 domain-containing protein [Acidobacteria bacterium]|nr:DUF952 domain-containing protein [Acidobacteriota bacterium]
MLIYHVTLPENWEYYKDRPSYQTESLQTEGFIHCSYEGQLETTLQRYYANAAQVVILTIETDKLFAKFVEEPSTNNEVFPHIYGRLNHNAIVSAELRDLKMGAAG